MSHEKWLITPLKHAMKFGLILEVESFTIKNETPYNSNLTSGEVLYGLDMVL